MMQLFARVLSFVSRCFRLIGLFQNRLPPQPLFDLFRIYKGVYCGGVMMNKNTDWEMHIDGDETLTLLSGRIELVLKHDKGEKRISLTAGSSAVIPAGIWHRQIVKAPSELLFMTFGDTTVHCSFDDPV